MVNDPIVAEVRATRDRLAAKFGYDLSAIYRDIKEQERASGRAFVSYPPRICERGARPVPAPPVTRLPSDG